MEEDVRLCKLMAMKGLCSRREADRYIERGQVLVNGVAVVELGTKVSPKAEIRLAPSARRTQSEKVTILLNKPVGYVSSQAEQGYRPASMLIKSDKIKVSRLATAGRLDIDSQGLLILTEDGRLARELIGPEARMEKEYLVRVEGKLDDQGLALLCEGLSLDGKELRKAHVEWINENQLRFVLKEGKKRQIRRMCEAVGLKVRGLKRVRIGRIKLGNLREGEWRLLKSGERF